jgi:hypothetical protein
VLDCSELKSGGRLLCAVLCAGLLVAPARADEAETARVAVQLSPADQQCVRWSALETEIQTVLARPVFAPAEQADVVLSLAIDAATPVAHLELRSAATGSSLGVRRLSAGECDALQESLALTLSLMLDFRVADIPALEAAAIPDPPQGETTSTESKPERHPEMTTRGSDDSWRWEARFAGGLDWGAAPGTSVGVGGAVGASAPQGGFVELVATTWLEQSFRRLSAEVDVRRNELTLAVCPVSIGDEHVRLRWCGNVTAGHISARGRGLAVDGEANDSTFAVGPQVAGYRLFGPLFLRVGATWEWQLRRARLVVASPTGPREVYEMSWSNAGVSFGLGLQFP